MVRTSMGVDFLKITHLRCLRWRDAKACGECTCKDVLDCICPGRTVTTSSREGQVWTGAAAPRPLDFPEQSKRKRFSRSNAERS